MTDAPSVSADSTDVLACLGRWLGAGTPCVLATVVSTFGSSPRPVGSLLAVSGDGEFAGSVSGGCVEGSVIAAARQLLAAPQRSRLLDYGVSDDRAWSVGLSCGGEIRVLLEIADRERMGPLVDAVAARRPVVRVVDLESGESAVHEAGGDPHALQAAFGAEAVEAADDSLARDRSLSLEAAGRRVLVQSMAPRRRLVIVGAVHIAQHLAPLAAATGYRVTVIDPRTAFATTRRFPGIALDRRWPAAALADIGLDRHTALVTLCHDAKLDDPALAAALDSEAFYVGALGSRRTQAARAERLQALGYGEEALARIHGPVGLDLGGREPAEIALAVMAEIVQVRHRS